MLSVFFSNIVGIAPTRSTRQYAVFQLSVSRLAPAEQPIVCHLLFPAEDQHKQQTTWAAESSAARAQVLRENTT